MDINKLMFFRPHLRNLIHRRSWINIGVKVYSAVVLVHFSDAPGGFD
jgi:hypothetical protein